MKINITFTARETKIMNHFINKYEIDETIHDLDVTTKAAHTVVKTKGDGGSKFTMHINEEFVSDIANIFEDVIDLAIGFVKNMTRIIEGPIKTLKKKWSPSDEEEMTNLAHEHANNYNVADGKYVYAYKDGTDYAAGVIIDLEEAKHVYKEFKNNCLFFRVMVVNTGDRHLIPYNIVDIIEEYEDSNDDE